MPADDRPAWTRTRDYRVAIALLVGGLLLFAAGFVVGILPWDEVCSNSPSTSTGSSSDCWQGQAVDAGSLALSLVGAVLSVVGGRRLYQLTPPEVRDQRLYSRGLNSRARLEPAWRFYPPGGIDLLEEPDGSNGSTESEPLSDR